MTNPTNNVIDFYQQRYTERKKVDFGRFPAIVVVDFILGFTDVNSPMGIKMESELKTTKEILDVARKKNIPIVFITMSFSGNKKDLGVWVEKIPNIKILEEKSRWAEVDPILGRNSDEIIINKKFPSAFFGTNLSSYLNYHKIDTLILMGCTASSCVRATAIDAMCHGYHTVLVEDAIGEFNDALKEISLLDLGSRYVDVTNSIEIVKHLTEKNYKC